MKIFVVAEPFDTSISVRLQKENGDFIVLSGQRCDDFMPAYGVQLKENAAETIREWLNVNSLTVSEHQQKLIEAKIKAEKSTFI